VPDIPFDHEITDIWRSEDARFVSAWEHRFLFEEGFLKSARASERILPWGSRTSSAGSPVLSPAR